MHVEYQCRNFIYTHRQAHTDTQTHRFSFLPDSIYSRAKVTIPQKKATGPTDLFNFPPVFLCNRYYDIISLLGRGILDILSICLSEAAVHQKNPKTVPIYVRTLGDTSSSKNGQNERK